MENKLKVGITHGDANGISYELIIKLLFDNWICELCTPILYGSSKVAAYYRKVLDMENFSLNSIRTPAEANTKRANIIQCVDDNLKVEIGKETAESAFAATASLNSALQHLDKREIDIIIMTPQGEASFARAGNRGFPEYLAKTYNVPEIMTILVGENIKIGFVTESLPLREVPPLITAKNLGRKLQMLHGSLKIDFSITKPKIAVLALNPHPKTGNGGEEANAIIPAIERARQNGIMAVGPFPADHFFSDQLYENFDAVLAMYHDQGLIPFQSLPNGPGAAYVTGIPGVCAFPLDTPGWDIAGQGIANAQGLRDALYLATDVFNNRRENLQLLKNPLPHYDVANNSNESDLNVEQIEGVRDDI
ncbi:MAG: 4-hydroxythreonine-4-phosphate dehydrogenase PdxA [Odoribacteraceae bacterium]|jgi:4-hydroxythreonine-4-phosphate dehydrogenase|nr:4-hydroxythreonine-4-phosphate dehydrogenase PdxA [Odoribacteraceae bacterium]